MQACPTGMALNTEKVCIRPTYNRAKFTPKQSNILNTNIVAVGDTQGQGQYTVGYYDTEQKVVAFSMPEDLASDGLAVGP